MSTAMMVLRSVVVVLMLFGSLLPGGTWVQVGAAAIALPLTIAALVRPLFGRLYLHTAVVVGAPLFAALLVPAVFLPEVGDYGQNKLFELATLSLSTALAATIITDRAHLLMFARVWVVFGFVVAIVVLNGGVGIANRATGAGDNPIGLARALALSAVAAVWLMSNKLLRPLPGSVAIVIVSLATFATGSKGPVVGAVLACAVMALSNARRRVRRTIQTVVAGIVLYLVVLLSPSLRSSRIGQFILDPTGVQDNIRTEGLRLSWLVVKDGPWQGNGYGSWSSAVHFPGMDYPHNIWAELAVEAGLLSMLVVISILIVVMVRLFLNGQPAAQLASGFLGAEAVSASLSGDVRARAFWFFLVLGYVVVRWGRVNQKHPLDPASQGELRPEVHGKACQAPSSIEAK